MPSGALRTFYWDAAVKPFLIMYPFTYRTIVYLLEEITDTTGFVVTGDGGDASQLTFDAERMETLHLQRAEVFSALFGLLLSVKSHEEVIPYTTVTLTFVLLVLRAGAARNAAAVAAQPLWPLWLVQCCQAECSDAALTSLATEIFALMHTQQVCASLSGHLHHSLYLSIHVSMYWLCCVGVG